MQNGEREGMTAGRVLAIIRDVERRLAEQTVREALEERLAEARAALAAGPADWAMQRVPLALFGAGLPKELRASRVSVFRSDSAARIERHENADQFSCLLRGALTIHVLEGGSWQARQFRADGSAQQRISYVARGLWHHPVCPAAEGCELVAFHTVPAAELIDEYAASRAEVEGRG
ncbi:MAG: hypothetical protein OXF22_08720 [Anaerolineaceae bacterium]|nr:hypothetical protein [Anaerolineaceae bacterium]